MNIQFKKGVLEMCVLSLLDRRDLYGYELVNEISKNIEISGGTIYPLLRKLKDEGFFTTYWRESQGGPPRKYYRITDEGRVTKNELVGQWRSFVCGVEKILCDAEPESAALEQVEKREEDGDESK